MWLSYRANMDVLVSLGTNASYIYSVLSIVHHHLSGHHESNDYKPTDFFETSAMLITFILLGKYLEAKAKGRTSDAITALLTLTPPTAILLLTDEKGRVTGEEEISSSLIHSNDLLKVSYDPDFFCKYYKKKNLLIHAIIYWRKHHCNMVS